MLERMPALQSRDYRLLFYETVLGAAARWALLLGRGWLVFELTDSTGAVGIVTFAGMAPFLFLGPIGGGLADRLDRRRMAIGAGAIGVVISLVLGMLVVTDVVETWHVVLLAVLQGTSMAMVAPAQEALMPSLVKREHLLNAITLGGLARHGSRVAGPLAGGVVLATLGAGAVFFLSAGLLGLAVVQVWRIRWRPAAAPLATGSLARSIGRDVAQGMGYAWRDRRVRLILSLVGAHCGLTMAFDSLMPRLATNIGGGSDTFSAIVVGAGVGALAGTLALSQLRQEHLRGPVFAAVGVGSGLSMIVLGLAQTPAMAVVGAALAGGTQATYMAMSATFIQSVIPDRLRGRVMSLYIMLAAGHMAFMNLGFGLIADSVGERVLLIWPGVLWVAVFLLAALAMTDLRGLLRRGQFAAVEGVA
ncbi:MAG: MFS transporter [Chloroflexota bacterium]|nr:MFS transporter [Chloroflexota bacterium]